MKLNNAQIFLYMQIFFMIFGVVLFFGLKALRDAHAEKAENNFTVMEKVAPAENLESGDHSCDFDSWAGKEIDYQALNETGRPYRILPPGSMMTMDFNPERINVHIDDHHIVSEITCG